MGLRDVESTLPPGFRFYPSDEELICHYLYRKVKSVNDGRSSEETMVEVDLHTREPWELPDDAKLSANEWYFFSFRDRKYTTGSRTNRATRTGYWKATGKDRIIWNPTTHAMVGMRKTLVFYAGRAPSGIKSCWVMHEFRLETPHSSPKEDWVLCRVFHKRKGDATGADQLENTGSSSPTLGFSVSSPSLSDLPMAVGPFVSGCHEQRLMTSTLLLQQQQQQQDQDLSSSSSSSSSNPALATTNMEALLQCRYFPSLQEMEMMMRRCEGGGGSSDQFEFLMDLGPQHVGGVGYNNDLPGWQ